MRCTYLKEMFMALTWPKGQDECLKNRRQWFNLEIGI